MPSRPVEETLGGDFHLPMMTRRSSISASSLVPTRKGSRLGVRKPHKAGELPLRSTAVLEDHIKPASKALGSEPEWDAYLSAHLQLHASTARGGPEGTTGTAATRRCANDDERLDSGSQRTETGSPFQRCKNGAGLEKTHDMGQLDIYGHGRCGNFRKISWLMVGAIGFEPMTSTV